MSKPIQRPGRGGLRPPRFEHDCLGNRCGPGPPSTTAASTKVIDRAIQCPAPGSSTRGAVGFEDRTRVMVCRGGILFQFPAQFFRAVRRAPDFELAPPPGPATARLPALFSTHARRSTPGRSRGPSVAQVSRDEGPAAGSAGGDVPVSTRPGARAERGGGLPGRIAKVLFNRLGAGPDDGPTSWAFLRSQASKRDPARVIEAQARPPSVDLSRSVQLRAIVYKGHASPARRWPAFFYPGRWRTSASRARWRLVPQPPFPSSERNNVFPKLGSFVPPSLPLINATTARISHGPGQRQLDCGAASVPSLAVRSSSRMGVSKIGGGRKEGEEGNESAARH